MRGVKNLKLKEEATLLRKRGFTYPMIEKKLSVSRATLSGWFVGLELSNTVKAKLLNRKKDHLAHIRAIALDLLKTKRENVICKIKNKIEDDFFSFNFDKNVSELLLAILYLGEGFKKTRSHIGLGNSEPSIVLIFVKLLRSIYNVENTRFRCYLHLRFDQNEKNEKKFWSNYLQIPEKYFRKTQFDKRTQGKKTWDNYRGVCAVYCYDAKIEKRIVYLQKYLINKILGP